MVRTVRTTLGLGLGVDRGGMISPEAYRRMIIPSLPPARPGQISKISNYVDLSFQDHRTS